MSGNAGHFGIEAAMASASDSGGGGRKRDEARLN